MLAEMWWNDLSLASRSLRRAKGFSGVAALTLAIGITGTTAMFALVQGVILRPFPVPDQDQIVVAWKELRTAGLDRAPFMAAEIDALRMASEVLESAAGVSYYGAVSQRRCRRRSRNLHPRRGGHR